MAEALTTWFVGGVLAGMLLYPAIEHLPNLGRWILGVWVRAMVGEPKTPRPRCPVYPIPDVRCVRQTGHRIPHTVYAEDVTTAGYARIPF
jgi:hypothetical protein